MRHSTLRRSSSFAVGCALLALAGTAAAQEPQPAQPAEPSPPPPPAAEPAPTPTQPAPDGAVVVPPPAHHRHNLMEHDAGHKKNFWEKWEWLEKLKVSGYLQPQLLWQWYDETASPNVGANGALPAGIGPNSTVAKADGTTTNGDYFRMRRARLKTEFMPTEGSRFVMEIDPFASGGTVIPPGSTSTGGGSIKGTGTIARTVEAQGIIHWPGGIGTTEFAAGIFKIPFGYEVLQSDADRPFIERSWSEQNIVPSEFDTGLRAYSSLFHHKLTINLAVVNGQTLGEKTFTLVPDLGKGKDFVGRINYNFGPFDIGVSTMAGQGQIVDGASLRYKGFSRWAFNGEIGFHHAFSKELGMTKIYAEITRAQNYDRGVNYGFALPTFPVDIVNGTPNTFDELGYFIRVEQDFTKWATLALRYDYYTPDSAQGNNGRDTMGAVAVVHFTKGLQWMLEFDESVDNVHSTFPAQKVGLSKHITTMSNVLQVRF